MEDMTTSISFVYFDVGGVVIRDFSKTDKWAQLKEGMGIPGVRYGEFDEVWKREEKSVCRGERSVGELVPILVKTFGIRVPDGYSLLADFVDRFEPNPGIWPVIEGIHKKARIGLLTNMYPGMLDRIRERGILPPEQWDAVMDSSVEKCAKPEPRFFELAEERSGTRGADILFVENTPRHIEEAKRHGWQTYLYDPGDTAKSNAGLAGMFGV